MFGLDFLSRDRMFRLLFAASLEMNSLYCKRGSWQQLSQPKCHRLTVTAFLGEENGSQSKKTSGVDDCRIKRAPSAFNLYVRSAFTKLRQSSEVKMKPTDILPKVASMWQDLSPEAKAPFEIEANTLKEAVAAKRSIIKEELKKNARPPPPYALFVKKSFMEHKMSNPDMTATDVMKKIAESWKNVSSEEKASLLDNYKEQMTAWKEKNSPL
ncbi:hypothetical protein CEUSTIGMA_g5201.t1 [Chlamydomonas eustigma]|uniref:HMG box domain-containing protein n=1 Tax=Chlamydomonas eustigma TaxID=1157962 RepID=A0A250X3V0_9CHLO|nr:hypothetical protein CEUSTIGMA_g5201.t1 [Chlamydomonas eustigma]|eukprot:GAX77758.1 hypothetical protein CEUSTIGMA_g5201.t1 [Chlamydomonas eustigma]